MAETDSGSSTEKRKRHRSPNYPAIPLSRAVDLAKKIYEKDKLHFVPENVTHGRWGYAPYGSQGLLCVAALRSYGLVTIRGSGKKREIAVTEDARHILLGAEDAQAILKNAALLPRIHAEVWQTYGGDLPQDDVLRHHLIFNLRFNEDSVDGFIEQLRETITFSGLQQGDSVPLNPEEGGEAETEGAGSDKAPSTQNLPLFKPAMNEARRQQTDRIIHQTKELRFWLPSGEARIFLPDSLTFNDITVLESYLSALKKALPDHRESPEKKDGEQ